MGFSPSMRGPVRGNTRTRSGSAGVRPLVVACLLAGVAVYVGWGYRSPGPSAPLGPSAPVAPRKADPAQTRLLLVDASQPWYGPAHQHTADLPDPIVPPISARTDLADAPSGARALPADIVDYLLVSQEVRKTPLPEGHPFRGRHFEVIDLRTREAWNERRVPYAASVPYERVAAELATGFLSRLERGCILVLYGERYPYRDAIETLRGAGFHDLYALEGGFSAWVEGGYRTDGAGPPREAVAAAPPKTGNTNPPLWTPAPSVSAVELYAALQGPSAPRVVFVSPIEDLYRQGHIPGAEWVPFDRVKEEFAGAPRDAKVVFYCGCCKGSSDGLSGTAVRMLQDMGFRDVKHLDGHLEAWKAAALPLATE